MIIILNVGAFMTFKSFAMSVENKDWKKRVLNDLLKFVLT